MTKKQICTFPYAPHSTPTFNARAYPVEIDNDRKPGTHWICWSPVHVPHYVGRFTTRGAAQDQADAINRMGAFIYGEWPPAEISQDFPLVPGEGAPQYTFVTPSKRDRITISQDAQPSLF